MPACSAYRKTGGTLSPCRCNPLRIITYQTAADVVSGEYCARHALELKRDASRGRLEILTDEPVAIPFQGEPLHNKEISTRDYYGV